MRGLSRSMEGDRPYQREKITTANEEKRERSVRVRI